MYIISFNTNEFCILNQLFVNNCTKLLILSYKFNTKKYIILN